MTATALLLALLALAYVGSMLMGGRGLRGYGLPSGAEYIVLGLVIGPYALGTVERDTLSQFQPVVAVGGAWLALIAGIEYGRAEGRRIPASRLVAGLFMGVVTGAVVGIAVYVIARRFASYSVADARLLAAGIAIVCSGANKHVGRWAVERYAAHGPVSELFEDVAAAADGVPLLALAPLFVFGSSSLGPGPLVPWGAAAATLDIGALLGVVAAVLLRVEAEAGDGWGVLLGAALLGTGVAWRLGWSSLTVLFVMSITIALLSRHRSELRAMLAATERPVLLPTLVLAAAQVEMDRFVLPMVAAAAVLSRVTLRVLIGWIMTGVARPVRGSGSQLGLALVSTSGLTVIIGVVFAFRFPGPIGAIVLATAAIVVLVGELVGPASLRRALARSGEITTPAAPPAPVEEPS